MVLAWRLLYLNLTPAYALVNLSIILHSANIVPLYNGLASLAWQVHLHFLQPILQADTLVYLCKLCIELWIRIWFFCGFIFILRSGPGFLGGWLWIRFILIGHIRIRSASNWIQISGIVPIWFHDYRWVTCYHEAFVLRIRVDTHWIQIRPWRKKNFCSPEDRFLQKYFWFGSGFSSSH